MTCSNRKNGIYQLRLSDRNPMSEFMIIKIYGDTIKQRMLPSIKDCRQQEEEWDEEYKDIFPEYTETPCPVYYAEPRKARINNYEIFDQDGRLVAKGDSLTLAKMFDVTVKRLANCALTSQNCVRQIFGEEYRYRIVKVME